MERGVACDLTLLQCYFNAAKGKKTYRLGAKPPLKAGCSEWVESDCSGFVRWILYWSSNGQLKFPAGSVLQHNYVKALRWQPCSYSETIRRDNVLRIAFINPRLDKPGHVWLVLNGHTIECYSPAGVDSRSWNAFPLRRADACYIVPSLNKDQTARK